MNTHLRPTRSPSAPNVRSKPAKKTAKASTIHCSWVEVACRLLTIDGRATLRIVLSRLMSNKVTQRTANVAPRRPRDIPALWTFGLPVESMPARRDRSVTIRMLGLLISAIGAFAIRLAGSPLDHTPDGLCQNG